MASAPKGQPAFSVHASVSQRDLDRVNKRLSQYQGRPLELRMEKATRGAASLMVNPLRAVAPVSDHGTTGRYAHSAGNLRKTIRAKALRKRGNDEIAAAYAGTTTYYGLWVQQGTREGQTPQPFVENTQRNMEGAINNYIEEAVRRLE